MKVDEILIGVVPEKKYSRFLEVVADPTDFPRTYGEYAERVQNMLARAKATASMVREIAVDPDDLVAFCSEQGLDIDTRGRQAYNMFKRFGEPPVTGW